MALIGLGVHHLSLVPSEVGPVKAMLRSIDAAPLERYLRRLLDLPDHSLRGRLQAYAQDHGVVLPTSVYQPI
jgi:phosphotransferase system enzyme I (PtsP)